MIEVVAMGMSCLVALATIGAAVYIIKRSDTAQAHENTLLKRENELLRDELTHTTGLWVESLRKTQEAVTNIGFEVFKEKEKENGCC